MRELADGPAAVLAGPIGRCCKRGWCRAVLLEAAIERRNVTAVFELTAAGRALIVAWP